MYSTLINSILSVHVSSHIDSEQAMTPHCVCVSWSEKWMWTFTILPLCVLTGSHIDSVCLRVLPLPGLYLRDKVNCLSLDRLLPLLPSVSLCAKICQVKSPHTLISCLTTCCSAEHYRWCTSQQTLPHGMLQTWQHNNTCKNIHKRTYNIITHWRHDDDAYRRTHNHNIEYSIITKKILYVYLNKCWVTW